MTNQHPITPPPLLVQQWVAETWHEGTTVLVAASDAHIATQAAQWGADQELEACKQFMHDQDWFMSPTLRMSQLHTARRPKPPSLKEQAIRELNDTYEKDNIDHCTYHTIRRALEALPNG